ncbi:MAG: glycosyltransferase family 9 protein [Verrucomicrobiae bacterium]|nr:glycosyltransferase family 9 protein [Verrucomicrobiae bacterium]
MDGPVADPSDVARVLLVKLTSLGDVIHGTAAMGALQRAFPQAEIAWAVDERFADVPRHHPGVTRVIEGRRFRADPLHELRELVSATATLRREGVDLAIDIQGTARSAAWVYASGAPIKAGRGGMRPGWRRAVRPDLGRHAVQVIAEILQSLGIPAPDPRPELHWPGAAEETVSALLGEHGIGGTPFAVINPFSRWPTKEWPIARFQELARRFQRQTGAALVLTGGLAESERGTAFARGSEPARVVSFAGALDLPGLFCLLKRARLVVTVDSGPMHAAAAVGTPVVALFGPTLPERTGPWGPGHRVLQAARPQSHHAYRRAASAALMERIGLDEVLEAAIGAWGCAPGA